MKYRKQYMYVPVLSVALGLFIYGIYMDAPAQTLVHASQLVANVSVGTMAAVDPNQFNTLAAQLEAKEKELIARERDVQTREAAAVPGGDPQSILPMVSFLMSLVLTVLVGINYWMDWRRGRRVYQETVSTINLRRG